MPATAWVNSLDVFYFHLHDKACQLIELITFNTSMHRFWYDFIAAPVFHTAIICQAVGSINNGTVSYSRDNREPFDFGTVATFMCDVGFFLEGTENRTCGGTSLMGPMGSWSESNPICSGKYLQFSNLCIL